MSKIEASNSIPNKIIKSCKGCESLFKTYPSQNTSYCSMDCYSNDTTIDKECEMCREKFSTPKSQDYDYCSKECYESLIEKKCPICDEKFEVNQCREWRVYCSRKCMAEAYSDGRLTGENHPRWVKKTEIECDNCGECYTPAPSRVSESKFCSWICFKESQEDLMPTGKNHPRYKGGRQRYYGSNWYKIRRKVLKRDDYECVICGRGKQEIGRSPSVHHIKPLRYFDQKENANTLINLITVCPKHHGMIEGWGLSPLDRVHD